MNKKTNKKDVDNKVKKPRKPRAVKVKDEVKITSNTPKQSSNIGHKSISQLVFETSGKRDLSEVFGEKTGKYEWNTEQEYESYLNDLNMTDMELHAIELGMKPKDDRDLLTRNLIRLFRADNNALGGSPVGASKGIPILTKEMERFLSGN